MKHRIKMVELVDGKKLYYPSDEELIGLNVIVCVIEEILTKTEYEALVRKYDGPNS